jgi:hypothetical protein
MIALSGRSDLPHMQSNWAGKLFVACGGVELAATSRKSCSEASCQFVFGPSIWGWLCHHSICNGSSPALTVEMGLLSPKYSSPARRLTSSALIAIFFEWPFTQISSIFAG